MFIKNHSSIPFLAILTTLTLWVPKEAVAISIKATATGSSNPTPIVGGDLQNGDFLIRNSIPGQPTGDGDDERTDWLFDFSSDSNLEFFPTSSPLESALLTLTISPGITAFTTDFTGISLTQFVNISDIPGIPEVGTTGTVSIDLLDFGFTSEDIINSLDPVTDTIRWLYFDDAVVSYAELELKAETESVPEPTSTLGMFGLGAMALFGYKRQRCS
ncbi:MAG: PEP-CTERM sorting domain-containing protein [Okeania sp. SIO3B5]|uniref:PEP-CTERM sorting domain-containing protein n=1 Tax=Okeania sp. SIO3B5 TaxID=2607811 RepID=UPI0014008AF4|nr:PEP-CTERM sorting domain-containing protein [Okeania sp. SIO3B5]NEO52806.1 PEP-CTERM sorting domain-containing protein [Okeania sp. SIO3B5]